MGPIFPLWAALFSLRVLLRAQRELGFPAFEAIPQCQPDPNNKGCFLYVPSDWGCACRAAGRQDGGSIPLQPLRKRMCRKCPSLLPPTDASTNDAAHTSPLSNAVDSSSGQDRLSIAAGTPVGKTAETPVDPSGSHFGSDRAPSSKLAQQTASTDSIPQAPRSPPSGTASTDTKPSLQDHGEQRSGTPVYKPTLRIHTESARLLSFITSNLGSQWHLRALEAGGGGDCLLHAVGAA